MRRDRWVQLAFLAMPSAPLAALLALELPFGGVRHFFLHTLTGWNVALIGLLAASYFGVPWSRWDGVALLALAVYAQLPDLLYIQGFYHRDWMDVFLFHIALDEIIGLALPALAVLWVVLVISYTRFRLNH